MLPSLLVGVCRDAGIRREHSALTPVTLPGDGRFALRCCENPLLLVIDIAGKLARGSRDSHLVERAFRDQIAGAQVRQFIH